MSNQNSKAGTVPQPPNVLSKRAVIPGASGIDYEAIERAEKALSALSSQFESWMSDELDALVAAKNQIHEKGKTEQTISTLFHSAHDIKGQAATLGFPLAGSVAASLCKLTMDPPALDRIPLNLIDQHVDSILAIVKEGVRDTENPTACKLTKRLTDVTNDFLAQLKPRTPDNTSSAN
ncbi:MAG: Hpt domain-containing protein [Fimbriimonadaceae bacterium]|nr:Hpt domain-containing protein [Alphaproteobacteria bacterium]